jgi:thioredoxin
MQIVACGNCGARNRVEESRLAMGEAKCGRCGEKLKPAAEQNSKPVNITDQTFDREVLQTKGQPVLVDCWAPWCGPCRMIAPVLDQLAAESQGRYRIVKLNVDENHRVSAQFKISSIPTMLIFKDGKLVDRLIGAQPKEEIAKSLASASRLAA